MIKLLGGAPRSPTEHRRLALGLGLVSIGVGSGIYWGWRFTRIDLLVMAGLGWLLVGLGILVVGFVLVARAKRRRRLPVLILLAGPFLALLYGGSALDVMWRVGIRVRNECPFPLENVRILASGELIPLGTLDSGGGSSTRIYPGPRGTGPHFSCDANGATVEERLSYSYGGEFFEIWVRPTPAGGPEVFVNDDLPRFIVPILP